MGDVPRERRRTDIKPQTDRLSSDDIKNLALLEADVTYRPIPYDDVAGRGSSRPVWRVRFELSSDPGQRIGLDINDEVVFGRDLTGPSFVDLSAYEGGDLGVSRRHLMIRPTFSKLFIIDLGSTNGTLRNGHSIGKNTPYSLTNGDTISLGKLQFVVRIVERPQRPTGDLREKADLADALAQTAKAITSQLELDEVLNQVTEVAMALTTAGETSLWLVDEHSGELFIEAQQGIEDERVRRIRLPVTDSLAGQVVATGEPVRASREPGGAKIKVKTGYLVESVIYVPLKLGGVTFGVLGAAHREPGKQFAPQDETLLQAIGDFAAIAVHNARLYEATDEALGQRVEELATLNELASSLSSTLDLGTVYKLLVAQLNKHWQIEASRLWLVNQQAKTVQSYQPESTPDKENTLLPFRIGRGIVGRVAENGQARLIKDATSHSDYDAQVDAPEGIQPKTMACMPLLIKGEVVGILALYNKKDGYFTDQDLGRLSSFANPVATAIENARLFAQSERERATVHATVNALSQPLLIIDDEGQLLISNPAATHLVENHLAQLFEGLSGGVGRTTEIQLGDETYITTTEHQPEVGTIVIMQDITYVKKLEQARAEFVNALSHDLKGPLSSIKGWAGLIEKTNPPENKSVTFANRIVKASNSLLEMITQLLDIALLSEVPQTYHVPCNLGDIVKKAIADSEGAALAKSMKVDAQQIGTPYQIKGDASRLYRSVLNLIDNAIKYADKNTRVLVTLTFSNERVVIQVRDDGPGIPEAELPHLFDRYFRGKGLKEHEAGVGLGLMMVQATAKAHGGEVAVRNVKGHGAEFSILLPGSLRVR
jgi:NtrC-family two-component system sensor histidine kinase KinB